MPILGQALTDPNFYGPGAANARMRRPEWLERMSGMFGGLSKPMQMTPEEANAILARQRPADKHAGSSGIDRLKWMASDFMGYPIEMITTLTQAKDAQGQRMRGDNLPLGPEWMARNVFGLEPNNMDPKERMGISMLSPDPFDAVRLGSGLFGAMTAFHGTPHRLAAEKLIELQDGTRRFMNAADELPQGAKVLDEFPLGRFRSDKIGTGEGAQAYGHGLYFAESPGVAKGYRRQLTRGIRIDVDAADHRLGYGVLDESSGKMRWFQNEKDAKEFKYDQLGALYTVDIPDSAINNMLDWDKPLSEQPESVQPFIEEMKQKWIDGLRDPNPVRRTMHSFMSRVLGDDFTGGDFYKALSVDPEKASEMLNARGIPGIRYLDQGSRTAGEGTRNFVVFDDSIVKVLDRK